MKTTFFDFFLCGIVISFILGTSLTIVQFGISPYTSTYVGSYTAIFNFFLFLLTYGAVSGLVIQVLVRVKPLKLGEFSMDHPNFTYWKLLTIVYRIGDFFLLQKS